MLELPGILVIETLQGPTVYISDQQGDIATWSHQQVCQDPQEFLKCLSTVMVAANSGPTSARQYLEDLRRDNPLVTGQAVCCSICGVKCRADSQFRLLVDSKNSFEYQCSEVCYATRKAQLAKPSGLLRKLQEVMAKTESAPVAANS